LSSKSKIRIITADDHQLTREGLKRIIEMEEDMEVVAECGDGIQVLELCNIHHPDVVLMDINMPVENGVTATERMRELFPDIKVLILSIHDDESYVFETLRKGASGYLLKDLEAEVLIQAIRDLEENGTLSAQPSRSTEVKFVAEKTPLTRREAEVLRLMAEGKSNKAIGEQLFISEKTVKNHVSSILQKMEVDDRTQAVINSIKRGWVTL